MTNPNDLASNMTKREFIAAIASLFITPAEPSHEARAKGAVMYADELIVQLNKRPQGEELPLVIEESSTAERRWDEVWPELPEQGAQTVYRGDPWCSAA